MKSKEKSSLSTLLLKIFGISLLLIFGITLAVRGDNLDLRTVKVVFDNGSEINILTTKSTVSQILSENHILLLEDETTSPSLEDELGDKNKIVISKISNEAVEASAPVEQNINLDTLSSEYLAITEKIITIREEIPFETIQKDISNNAKTTTNKVLQNGVPGIKEVKYRVKYQGDVEIEREEISSTVIKKPINKIVQVVSRQTSSRSYVSRESTAQLAQKVEGITPIVKTMNTSAYTASTCDKSPSDPGYGITASGAKASSWYTVAAGKSYPMGTVIYIPYFKNKPNGGWFVVQDRGGAISNAKLDVYMDTYNDCIKFGRQNLECYIYVL